MKNTTTILTTMALATVVGASAGCAAPSGDLNRDAQETRSATTVAASSPVVSALPVTSVSPTPRLFKGDIESLLTPPRATVVNLEPGRLVLVSSDSVEALTAFYDNALARLGAQPSEAAIVGADWGYDGTYNVDHSIQVSVVDADGRRHISISY